MKMALSVWMELSLYFIGDLEQEMESTNSMCSSKVEDGAQATTMPLPHAWIRVNIGQPLIWDQARVMAQLPIMIVDTWQLMHRSIRCRTIGIRYTSSIAMAHPFLEIMIR